MLFIFSGLAQAMPYTCESIEKAPNDRPVMRFRINKKMSVNQNGRLWKLNVVNVAPPEGFRKTIYGQGRITETEIGMSFVKDSFVVGMVLVYNRGEEGIYEGEARISDLNQGSVTQVRCINDQIKK